MKKIGLLYNNNNNKKQAVASTGVTVHHCWNKYLDIIIMHGMLPYVDFTCFAGMRIAYKCDASLKKWQDLVVLGHSKERLLSQHSSPPPDS